MKLAVPIALILLGALLILAPLVSHAYEKNHDKQRVAEFYTSRGNAEVLPDALRPTEYTVYDFFCFFAGVVMVGVGVIRSRPGPLAAQRL